VTSAAQLLKGKWSARWANWAVGLEWKADGWEVAVWRQLPGKTFRHPLGTQGGFLTTSEAVSWACKVMRDNGASVLVLGAPGLTLETALSFTPTLEVVHA
jgi:hypothetical protein